MPISSNNMGHARKVYKIRVDVIPQSCRVAVSEGCNDVLRYNEHEERIKLGRGGIKNNKNIPLMIELIQISVYL